MSYQCPRCQSHFLFQPELCPTCSGQIRQKQKRQRAQERRGSYDLLGKVNEAEFWQLLRLYSACPCCGLRWENTDGIARDHIVPLSRGGSNTLANLQPLCNRCNLWKSDATIYFDRAEPGIAVALPERLRPLLTTPLEPVAAQLSWIEPPTPRYPHATPAALEAETLRLTQAAIVLATDP